MNNTSKVWPSVTSENPCPICGHGDWCLVGDWLVNCMRVESQKTASNGGWYHNKPGISRTQPIQAHRQVKPRSPVIFSSAWDKLLTAYREYTIQSDFVSFAQNLSVNVTALIALDACWAGKYHNAWAFPMSDAIGNTIGIRLRSLDGKKWAINGSKSGLFIPKMAQEKELWICEGPTSCAALLSMGFHAVGRADCNSGAELLAEYIKRNEIRSAVVVGDNDNRATHNGHNPGVDGAYKLGPRLGCRYVVWTPPCKDVRDYMKQGATKDIIISQTKDLICKR